MWAIVKVFPLNPCLERLEREIAATWWPLAAKCVKASRIADRIGVDVVSIMSSLLNSYHSNPIWQVGNSVSYDVDWDMGSNQVQTYVYKYLFQYYSWDTASSDDATSISRVPYRKSCALPLNLVFQLTNLSHSLVQCFLAFLAPVPLQISIQFLVPPVHFNTTSHCTFQSNFHCTYLLY